MPDEEISLVFQQLRVDLATQFCIRDGQIAAEVGQLRIKLLINLRLVTRKHIRRSRHNIKILNRINNKQIFLHTKSQNMHKVSRSKDEES